MKVGDVVLVKGKEIVDEIIEDVENSNYSHVAVYVGNNRMIEAVGFKKTGYVNVNKYETESDVFRLNGLSEMQKLKLLNYLNKQVGSYYNYFLLLWEFFRYEFHLLLPYKKDFNSHICSTLVNDAYKSIGINLCPHIKYPSPADIACSKLLKKVSSF